MIFRKLIRRIAAEYVLILDGDLFLLEIDFPEEDIELPIDASLVERASPADT